LLRSHLTDYSAGEPTIRWCRLENTFWQEKALHALVLREFGSSLTLTGIRVCRISQAARITARL